MGTHRKEASQINARSISQKEAEERSLQEIKNPLFSKKKKKKTSLQFTPVSEYNAAISSDAFCVCMEK